jgi:hypothetical protein
LARSGNESPSSMAAATGAAKRAQDVLSGGGRRESVSTAEGLAPSAAACAACVSALVAEPVSFCVITPHPATFSSPFPTSRSHDKSAGLPIWTFAKRKPEGARAGARAQWRPTKGGPSQALEGRSGKGKRKLAGQEGFKAPLLEPLEKLEKHSNNNQIVYPPDPGASRNILSKTDRSRTNHVLALTQRQSNSINGPQ